MTYSQTVKLLAVLRETWPRFYANQTDAGAETAARVWHSALRDEPEPIVLAALEDCVRTSQYPPVPADICKRAEAIRHAEEPTADMEFACLVKAARNGFYSAESEYAKLPRSCQEFVGSPAGLAELAMLDIESLHTVTRGQFLRQQPVMAEKARLRDSLPDSVRKLIASGIKELPAGGAEGQTPFA